MNNPKPLKPVVYQNKDSEVQRIFKALTAANKPLTRRELKPLTGLEISTLCRALYNLVYDVQSIIIAHYAPCQTTGKKVMHFAVKEGSRNDL